MKNLQFLQILLTLFSIAYCECSCSDLKIEAITAPVQHSEGPFWDAKNNVLYYVDTFQATIHRFNPGVGHNRDTHTKIEGRDSVGVIIPIQDRKNEFVVTADRYIYNLKWDGVTNDTGKVEEIQMIEGDKPKNQFNDGKADALGRLWTGTLTREPDLSVSPNGGALYRIDIGKDISTQVPNTSISNGLAWSGDNKQFYFSDSQTRKVFKFDFDLETGELGESRVLIDLEDHPKLKGIADGLTIDKKNNLWIALHGGHGIIHVDGQTGKLLKYVKLPATYCTSAVFGGASQEILFVTTSRLKLSEEDLKKEPLAGAVFAIKGIACKGPPDFEIVLN